MKTPFKFLNIASDDSGIDIYLNGEIVSDNLKELYDWLGIGGAESPKSFKAMLDEAKGKPLTVHINSPGGDWNAGQLMYAQIKDYKGETTAIVDGICASAAVFPLVACKKAVARASSVIMIHQVMMGTFGNQDELKDDIDMLETLDNASAIAYQQKTGLPIEQIRAMMKAETWLDAKKGLELGFIDEIEGDFEKIKPVIKNIIDNNKRLVACLRGFEQPASVEPVKADNSSSGGSKLFNGKFTSTEELEKAYANLESEYTKKCQKLAEVSNKEELKQQKASESAEAVKARFEFAKLKTKF